MERFHYGQNGKICHLTCKVNSTLGEISLEIPRHARNDIDPSHLDGMERSPGGFLDTHKGHKHTRNDSDPSHLDGMERSPGGFLDTHKGHKHARNDSDPSHLDGMERSPAPT